MSSISTIINRASEQTTSASPFSFLRKKKPVNLDPTFPDSRKNYTYEIGKEISLHMKANGITFATITTKSQTGVTKKPIVHLRSLKRNHPELLRHVTPQHPDLSQHLYDGHYIVNPSSLTT